MNEKELLDTLAELERRVSDRPYSGRVYVMAMYAVIDVYRRTSREGLSDADRDRLINAAIQQHLGASK